MRWSIATITFFVTAFIFFIFFTISSLLLSETMSAMSPFYAMLGDSTLNYYQTLLPTAFGVICVIFFVAGILVYYFIDATSDESDYYEQY